MASDLLSTPPPLAPPRRQGEMVSWLRLIRSHRVGVSTFFRLMKEHGTADAALDALPGIASAAGVRKYSVYSRTVAEDEIEQGLAAGAQLVFYGSKKYPASLRDIPDPPPVLWALGDLSLGQRPSIALVGARNASSLGMRMAAGLANDLGNAGYAIVSGLARGIDTAAHTSALPHGTIAVQAGGIGSVYPRENKSLHDDIARTGLRLSEQPIGLQPQARHFPRRNRIISGLGLAVVVVEAAAKSGSLITARDALDQGRDVLAVPGHPLDARATGCNLLIRDGATLIRNAQDIIQTVGRPERESPAPLLQHAQQIQFPFDGTPKSGAPDSPVPENHSQAHPLSRDTLDRGIILDHLSPTPIAEDQLIRDLGFPTHKVTPELILLEMAGKITRHPGGFLSRNV